MLADAGYKGEKVVLLVPSDVPYLNADARCMAAQTMRSIGLERRTCRPWTGPPSAPRRAKRDAPEAGGWNMYVTVAGEFDANSPIANAYLSARRAATALPGWPCDKKLDELRTCLGCKADGAGQAQGTARRLPVARLRGRALHQRGPVLGRLRHAHSLEGRGQALGPACRSVLDARQVSPASQPREPRSRELHPPPRSSRRCLVMAVVRRGGVPADPPRPGDPAALIAGDSRHRGGHREAARRARPQPAAVAAVRAGLGPLATGDLGTSIFTQVPVPQLLGQRLGAHGVDRAAHHARSRWWWRCRWARWRPTAPAAGSTGW